MNFTTGFKILFTLLLVLVLPLYAVACICRPITVESSYTASSHVSLVKVLNIEFDPKDVSKLLLKVKVLDQLKGAKVIRYKTDATFFKEPTKDGVTGRYDCAFDVEVGSTWLIFASCNEKIPFFHYCSKSTGDTKLIAERLASIKAGFK